MREDRALIQRTLDGDEQAFARLVDKYQKQIHALVWQKIGDFHIAQEIAQDVFITAYNNLATLNYRNRFAGWLYVIADNKCKNWHRKKKITLESLENMDPVELDKVYYAEYLSDQREKAAKEKKRSLVHKLISKLEESERTVVNLYYIAEMNCEDIGKFIGVSPNTVRSRLYRARERLKKEESMLTENLSSFQLPSQFTEKIMENIMNSKPITPSVTKPLIPLAISAATALIAVLLIGVGAQHILSFQKPFNLDALSDQTVEITEAQLLFHTDTVPKLRLQTGRIEIPSQINGIGQNLDSSHSTEAVSDTDEISDVAGKWLQAASMEGGPVPTLFATTGGDLFAGTLTGLYRLSDDGDKWELIRIRNAPPFNEEDAEIGWGVMAERNDTLYIATDTEIISSSDRGKTWLTVGTHPGGLPTGFVKTKDAYYIGFSDRIYYSDDKGVDKTTWKLWSIEESGEKTNKTNIKIHAIESIKDTVFVGTDKGLYRMVDESFVPLPVGDGTIDDKEQQVLDIAVSGGDLFVAIIDSDNTPRHQFSTGQGVTKSIPDFGWVLYHSYDKGNTWKLIADKEHITEPNRMYFPFQTYGPRKHQFPNTVMGPNFNVKISATKGRIVVLDTKYQSYALNHDGNWVLDDTTNMLFNIDKAAATTPVFLNPNVIYKSHRFGILRSLDGGKNWMRFNHGIYGRTIWDIFIVDDYLYAYTPNGIIGSNDGGESWKNVFLDAGDITVSLNKSDQQVYVRTDRMINIMADVNGLNEEIDVNARVIDEQVGNMNILRIQSRNSGKSLTRVTPTYIPKTLPNFETLPGNFTVTDSAFYAESNNNLYRWKYGTLDWYDTRLAEEIGSETPDNDSGLKIAALENKLYVGMMNGHLLQSLDEGESWTDVTSNLPFTVASFKTVVFAGESLYVATDKGVIRSTDGKDWDTLLDEDDNPLVMNKLAVTDTTVYGESGQIIYSINIENEKWMPVTPKIAYPVACFDADGSKLYVGTYGSGLLLYELDE